MNILIYVYSGTGSAFGAPSTSSNLMFGQKTTSGGLFGSSAAKVGGILTD